MVFSRSDYQKSEAPFATSLKKCTSSRANLWQSVTWEDIEAAVAQWLHYCLSLLFAARLIPAQRSKLGSPGAGSAALGIGSTDSFEPGAAMSVLPQFFLKTKLLPPRLGRQVIARPRLIERMRGMVDLPATIV